MGLDKMKILMHCGTKPNPGGVENAIFSLAEKLKQYGCDVKTVFGYPGERCADYYYLKGYPSKLWNIDRKLSPFLLFQVIKHEKFDLIHSHAQWAYDAAMVKKYYLPNLKIVVTFHGLEHALLNELKSGYFIHKSDKNLIRDLRIKWYLEIMTKKVETAKNYYDATIAVSREVANQVRTHLGIDSIVIPNGVDLKEIDNLKNNKNRILSKVNYSRNTKIVAFIGNSAWRKGFYYLLEAFKNLPSNYMLVTVGNDPVFKKVMKFNFLRYRYYHFHNLSNDETLKIISSADVVVLPSIHEGMPLTMLEAFAVGTPLIISKVEGTEEVVKNMENAILIPKRDATAIYKSIMDICENKIFSEYLVKNAKETINSFTWDVIAGRTLEFYKGILAE